MRLKSLVLRSLAALGALSFGTRPAFAQTAAQIEEAVRGAVSKLDLQTEIPQPSGFDFNLPAIPFSSAILWTALAVTVGLLLYSARDDLPRLIFGRSRRWRDVTEEDPGLAAESSSAQAALTADELASAAHYREAMHVLLLQAIAELRNRLGTEFARSLTSREIARRANLPEIGKAAFRDIIGRVELSYFGSYPATAQDYAACRSSYDRLIERLGEQGGRA